MPIHLTTDELDAVLAAARPLAPDRRQAFVAQVATALQSLPMIGPGSLHRVIAEAQREHFDPPRFADMLNAPRLSRADR